MEPSIGEVRTPRRSKAEWERVILARALETFGRSGFAVPMSQLIHESGAPTGTYYRLFADKGAVFARLLDDLHPLFLERVRAEVSRRSPAARLEDTVAAMVHLALSEFREVARLYLRDVRGAGSAHAAARHADERERAELSGLIVEGVAAGELHCANPELTAIAISGMVRKVVETYAVDGRRRPPAATAAAEVGRLAVLAAGGEGCPLTGTDR